MFFSDSDLYDSLKLSLETLTEIVTTTKDVKEKRKASVALASIVMQIVKLESDKEDWQSLLGGEPPITKEEDDDEFGSFTPDEDD
jgi:hypothetical protein